MSPDWSPWIVSLINITVSLWIVPAVIMLLIIQGRHGMEGVRNTE